MTARRFARRVAAAAHSRRGEETPAKDVRGHAVGKASPAEIVLDAFSAVEQRDEAHLRELYHPDVEFHWPRSLPYGGSTHGERPEPQLGWTETWDPLQPTPAQRAMSPSLIAASGENVVVLWHQRGIGANGAALDEEVLGFYQVRDGKFARAQMFYFDSTSVRRFLETAHAGPDES